MGGPRPVGALLGPILYCWVLLARGATARPGDHCRTIDCALQMREHCPSGSDVCGPCLQGLTESSDGKCLETSPKDKNTIPNIEAEIDYLASMIANQDPNKLQLADGVNTTNSPPPPDVMPSVKDRRHPGATLVPENRRKAPLNDTLLLGVVIACAISGLMALMVAGICWYRMRREMKLAEKTDYPAFKASPPPPYEKTSPGDKKLAHNAQMYHYQHQKQQMLSMGKNKDEPKHTDSAMTSDEENEDGDFTVYECPGLAPTGEMEVKNPLFDDSSHSPAHKTP